MCCYAMTASTALGTPLSPSPLCLACSSPAAPCPCWSQVRMADPRDGPQSGGAVLWRRAAGCSHRPVLTSSEQCAALFNAPSLSVRLACPAHHNGIMRSLKGGQQWRLADRIPLSPGLGTTPPIPSNVLHNRLFELARFNISYANPFPRLPLVLTLPLLPPSHSSFKFSTKYFSPLRTCTGTPFRYLTCLGMYAGA